MTKLILIENAIVKSTMEVSNPLYCPDGWIIVEDDYTAGDTYPKTETTTETTTETATDTTTSTTTETT